MAVIAYFQRPEGAKAKITVLDTRNELFPGDFPSIWRDALNVLQVNLGYVCNQSCLHCHVAASPKRTELMSWETIEQVLRLLSQYSIEWLDLTGGAPELNPYFRRLITQARQLGVQVIDRCNLTVLFEPGQADLAEFLANQGVKIVASLPCYLAENVDGQRGEGVHEKSIRALQRLNALGYGQNDSGLVLDLVFNPLDARLPPMQCELERAYKQHLENEYGIVFNRLLALANMPIKRFGSQLMAQNALHDYLRLLKQNHQPENLAQVMCRTLVSVDWQGRVFDCDFNQMLGLPLCQPDGTPLHIADLDVERLQGRAIQVGNHCYACTAGQGSSCGGALN